MPQFCLQYSISDNHTPDMITFKVTLGNSFDRCGCPWPYTCCVLLLLIRKDIWSSPFAIADLRVYCGSTCSRWLGEYLLNGTDSAWGSIRELMCERVNPVLPQRVAGKPGFLKVQHLHKQGRGLIIHWHSSSGFYELIQPEKGSSATQWRVGETWFSPTAKILL